MTRGSEEEQSGGEPEQQGPPGVEWGPGSEPVEDEAGDQAPPASSEDNPDSVARYYEQYYAQPYYSWYKPRRKPPSRSRRVWTIIVVSLLVVAAGLGLGYLAMAVLQQTRSFLSLPPAAVHAGTPLSWRELDSWPGGTSGVFGSTVAPERSIVTADFDGDGNDSLVVEHTVFGPSSPTSKPTLYELDGTQRELPFDQIGGAQQPATYLLGAWDHDGDGTVEVLRGVVGTEVLVCTLAGDLLTRVQGYSPNYYRQLSGDFDGDGLDELLLIDPAGTGTLNALDGQGNAVWSCTSQQGFQLVQAGDLDGDGRDELLDSGRFSPTILGLGENPQKVAGLPSGASTSACLDLNGDGTDEIICSSPGYLDLVSGSFTNFVFPATGTPAGFTQTYYGGFGPWHIPPVAGDFDGDGSLEIALAAVNPSPTGMPQASGLYIFDLSGALTYYEELGEVVHSVAVAREAGQDHLVVLTDTRLLIYP